MTEIFNAFAAALRAHPLVALVLAFAILSGLAGLAREAIHALRDRRRTGLGRLASHFAATELDEIIVLLARAQVGGLTKSEQRLLTKVRRAGGGRRIDELED